MRGFSIEERNLLLTLAGLRRHAGEIVYVSQVARDSLVARGVIRVVRAVSVADDVYTYDVGPRWAAALLVLKAPDEPWKLGPQ